MYIFFCVKKWMLENAVIVVRFRGCLAVEKDVWSGHPSDSVSPVGESHVDTFLRKAETYSFFYLYSNGVGGVVVVCQWIFPNHERRFQFVNRYPHLSVALQPVGFLTSFQNSVGTFKTRLE